MKILGIVDILHSFIRQKIIAEGFSNAVSFVRHNIVPNIYVAQKKIKIRKLNDIAKHLLDLDFQGGIVTSCLSIALLMHLILIKYKYESTIIIGVCVVDEKLYSHAWVECEGAILGIKFDDFVYKPIKYVSLLD